MAGAGYRTFQSGEVLTSNNVQTYLMDQAVQVYSGTAARASAVPSPSTGMVAYSTATGMQVFNGSAWVNVGSTGYGVATGGASTASATISGIDYTILTFTATSTLTVTTAGFFDYLMVGGGNGSRFVASATTGSGGGGAGSLVQGSVYLSANQTITIGAGSPTAASSTRFEAGTSSIGTAIYAPGAASSQDNPEYYVGSGSGTINANAPTALTNGLGNVGGIGSNSMGGGGGGGFVSAGGAAGASSGGNGGNGYDVSGFIGGATTYKAAGGGGGVKSGNTPGSAGNGGVAGTTNTTPPSAAANSGSGGAGGIGTQTTGNGGSGIAYIRFRS